MCSAAKPTSTDASDEQLLLRYRDQHDSRAFDELVHRYERPMYNYLVRYVGRAELAEEVFQATFCRLHEKCHSYTPGRRVAPWLYSIATHQAIDALRREGRHAAVSLDDQRTSDGFDVHALIELLKSSVPTPPEAMEEREREQWTRRAVQNLPDHLRVIILLLYFQGLKYREIAEILELPVGTVKSRSHRALLELNWAWHHDHPRSRED